MAMGWSPTAWTFWLYSVFLFVTRFLITTILVTVVRTVNEEHQFLFAVNTVSTVKSDALFPYIAPTSIIVGLLRQLKTFLTSGQYVDSIA